MLRLQMTHRLLSNKIFIIKFKLDNNQTLTEEEKKVLRIELASYQLCLAEVELAQRLLKENKL